MSFENSFYAQLEEPDGSGATEVLVDPATGAVQLECGPAMMWNTRYGVHRRTGNDRLSADQAVAVAGRWRRAGTASASRPVAFPGYFTLHTVRAGRVEGMVSVHAGSGTVWYHGWHGRLLEVSGHT